MSNAIPPPRRPAGVLAGARKFVRESALGRQWWGEETMERLIWDVLLATVVPQALLWMDRAAWVGVIGGIVPLRPYPGVIVAMVAMTLVVWLPLRTRLGAWNAFAAGVFAMAALSCFGTALLMLPISLIGIIFAGIGLLGFIPFVSAFSYARLARRAMQSATGGTRSPAHAPLFVGALLLALGGAYACGRAAKAVTRVATDVVVGDRVSKREGALVGAMHVLYIVPGVSVRRLNDAALTSQDAEVAAVYKRITGRWPNDLND